MKKIILLLLFPILSFGQAFNTNVQFNKEVRMTALGYDATTNDSMVVRLPNGKLAVQVIPGGGAGSSWDLTGNSGTTVGTNFIGTTDNKGLMFKTNSIQSGYINIIKGNISFGIRSLLNNATGIANNGIGENALRENTDGSRNNAFGTDALRFNTTADENTAFGNDALRLNTIGELNTAVGSEAMRFNDSGVNNVAMGWSSLYNNTTGSGNIAIGYKSNFSTNFSYTISLGYNAAPSASKQEAHSDSITSFYLKNIPASHNTTDSMIVFDKSTGLWGYRSIPSSSGGGSDTASITIKTYGILGNDIVAEPAGMNIWSINSSNNPDTSFGYMVAVTLSKAKVCTGIEWFQQTLGNYNAKNSIYAGVALFTYNTATSTFTLVDSCAKDTTLLKSGSSNVWTKKAFSQTVSLSAGVYYAWISYAYQNIFTFPTIGSRSGIASPSQFKFQANTGTPYLACKKRITTVGIPTSFNVSTVTAIDFFVPYITLY